MDILTKVRSDHQHINLLLRQVINKAQTGNKINNFLEDLREEIKEHIQAERICLLEMFLEKQSRSDQIFSQIDKERISKVLSHQFYQEFGGVFEDKDLENKLCDIEKILKKHSCYVENTIQIFLKKCISNQKSEELSLKFEQEKIKTLIMGITYA